MIIGMTASVCSFIYTCLVYVIYLKKQDLRMMKMQFIVL